MSLSIDHIVIRVQDLEQTIADFTTLGFTVQRGGTHADGATHNALIGFADGSYVELIAFLRDAPEHRWWDASRRIGDGFVDYALLPQSVASTIAAARERGLSYDGPLAGGRLRPDGERLEWQIGKPSSADLPFLCGDVTPRHLRVAEGDVRHHANGAHGVANITLAVHDLDASLARYRALLGEPDVQRAPLPGYDVALAILSLGATTLTLASPTRETRPPAEGLAADIRHHLASRGEGVFAVALETYVDGAGRRLERTLAHGAIIELVANPSIRRDR
ncbi:catechol 2,3-dioxygenase-like lactoylglutathione lyase family enzyme [Paraburkholderia atlantica]|uniref:Catechol 2,3-dioxygenase-like lactoylglutathione lyase family enzyme n=1 Tax=Paraburkholderia atlantica TaxID=2654982 RepID=A0A7W8V5Q2_PARAM|nr:VOC family protein [Paraburkholderia atlantica]MBB5423863.1 catechol 2,3-dioxygenase-like lactoylglutathione lyase family enzyme [Paraburkholderia atlantica]